MIFQFNIILIIRRRYPVSRKTGEGGRVERETVSKQNDEKMAERILPPFKNLKPRVQQTNSPYLRPYISYLLSWENLIKIVSRQCFVSGNSVQILYQFSVSIRISLHSYSICKTASCDKKLIYCNSYKTIGFLCMLPFISPWSEQRFTTKVSFLDEIYFLNDIYKDTRGDRKFYFRSK